jgi:hypothetical protein
MAYSAHSQVNEKVHTAAQLGPQQQQALLGHLSLLGHQGVKTPMCVDTQWVSARKRASEREKKREEQIEKGAHTYTHEERHSRCARRVGSAKGLQRWAWVCLRERSRIQLEGVQLARLGRSALGALLQVDDPGPAAF